MAVVKPIILTDLDDSLFQTEAKVALDAAGRVAACDQEGRPRSFMTAPQGYLFDWLIATTILIPVTGRSVDAFARVDLPFDGPAVCSYGGVVLDRPGQPNAVWRDQVAAGAEQHADAMDDLRRLALDGPEALRARVIVDTGVPIYLSVKHNDADTTALAVVFDRVKTAAADGWTLHLNNNNMAVIPPGIGKVQAARWLLDRLIADGAAPADGLVMTIGDSLSDLPFMRLGHLVAYPGRSQIAGAVDAALPDPTVGPRPPTAP